MANVFKVAEDGARIFLEELAEELDSDLSLIAFAGNSSDLKWIRKRQRQIKKDYDKTFRRLDKQGSIDALGFPGKLVRTAYIDFLDLGKDTREEYHSPKYLEEEAQNILYENLVLPEIEDLDEESQAEFRELLESYKSD